MKMTKTTRVEVEGVRAGVRPHPKRPGLWELRLTWEKRQKSFYGDSPHSAIEAAAEYVRTRRALGQVRVQEELLDDLGYWIAVNLTPLYAAKDNRNTREKGLWAVGVVSRAANGTRVEGLTLAKTAEVWAKVKKAHPVPNTQRTLFQYLSKALRLLAREGKVKYNFCEELDRPAPTKRKDVPRPEQALALWLAYRDDHLGPKIFLEFVLGLSDDEANSVLVEDVGESSLLVRGTKTDHRERTVHLPARISQILKAYARRRRRYLVENTKGNPVCSGSTRDMKLRFERHGLAWCGNHGLRHAFATGVEAYCGCPPSVRMAVMGQETTQAVQQTYVHPTPGNQVKWLQVWSDFLGLERDECLPFASGTTWVRPFSGRAKDKAL